MHPWAEGYGTGARLAMCAHPTPLLAPRASFSTRASYPQASGLARKALSVFQTYIEMMNDDIKTAFAVSTH